VSINLEEIRERSVLTRDGFYHVVGVHYAIREADFNALVAEVEHLRGDRAAVVAWLRDVAETMNHNGDKCCGRVEDLATAVARGEHRREEEP
jgi:hypothetical protein